MSFKFTPHPEMPDVIIVEGQRFEDQRGFYSECFRENEFKQAGIPHFIQESHSRSVSGVFRGLHYQLKPHGQGKLVYCVSGFIMDYVVDIRKGSPTYGKYIKILLGEDKIKMAYIPLGFAHGFKAYGNFYADVVYKITNYYAPNYERAIRWNDPGIGIHISGKVSVSEKDAKAPLLKDAENNFVYGE